MANKEPGCVLLNMCTLMESVEVDIFFYSKLLRQYISV